MTQDITALLEERGARYGKFIDHAWVTQTLKDVVDHQGKKNKAGLASDQKEALDMICHKVGRIVCGDPDYVDSWRDIAGYALLVADRLEGVLR
jgi:hypothetical protein